MAEKALFQAVSAILTLLLLSSVAVAQTATMPPFKTVKAGLTPGDPFYFMDLLGDWLKVATSAGDVKIKLRLDVSRERLLEAKQLRLEEKHSLAEDAERKSGEALMNALQDANRVRMATVGDSKRVERLKKSIGLESLVNERVLQDIINGFKTDSNPNNDAAIPALQRAVEASLKINEVVEDDIEGIEKNLKAFNEKPSLEDVNQGISNAQEKIAEASALIEQQRLQGVPVEKALQQLRTAQTKLDVAKTKASQGNLESVDSNIDESLQESNKVVIEVIKNG